MNYLLSFLFLFLILNLYIGLGYILDIVFFRSKQGKYIHRGYEYTLFYGFVIVNILQFFVGFICQLNSLSWNIYSGLMKLLFIFTIIGIICFYLKKRKNINIDIKSVKKAVLCHIRENWFIYLITIVFTLSSMMNMQQYVLCNYNDDHYLLKIVHSINSNHLLEIQQSTANLLNNSNISYAKQAGYRIFNTYEVYYAFLANLFKISPVFFCRVSITFHNYLIFFFISKLISNIFLDRKISQYGLLVYSLFLIPSGIAAKGTQIFKIRMFENWRFQTAMYMGGSVTRLFAFPMYTVVFFETINKKSHKIIYGFLMILSVFFALLSYQTISISYLLLMIFILINIFIFYELISSRIKFKYVFSILIPIALLFLAALINKYISTIGLDKIAKFYSNYSNGINVQSFQKSITEYNKYYIDSFKFDFFAKFSWILLVIGIIFESYIKDYQKLSVLTIGAMLYFIFRSNLYNYLLAIITFLFFGTARLLTSMLMFTSLLFGIVLTLLIDTIINKLLNSKNQLICSSISMLLLVCVISFNYNNRDKMKEYTLPGDTISKYGFSTEPIASNNKFLPGLFVEIGNYFDQKSQNYYSVATENTIKYHGRDYSYLNLYMASNKIISINQRKYKVDPTWAFKKYLTNDYTYHDVEKYLRLVKMNYILTTRKNIKADLVTHGYKCVVGGDKNDFWLMYKKM